MCPVTFVFPIANMPLSDNYEPRGKRCDVLCKIKCVLMRVSDSYFAFRRFLLPSLFPPSHSFLLPLGTPLPLVRNESATTWVDVNGTVGSGSGAGGTLASETYGPLPRLKLWKKFVGHETCQLYREVDLRTCSCRFT